MAQPTPEILSYIDLMKRKPEMFPMMDSIVTDMEALVEYAEFSGKRIGLVYESPWHYLLVDVVADADGRPLYPYERYVSVTSPQAGGVAVPVLPDGRICLLENRRHSLGRTVLELPRGGASGDETGEQTAVRELAEELGAESVSCHVLGEMIADSGVNGDVVTIARVDIEGVEANIGHEGIEGCRMMTLTEIDQAFADGEITDGFTLGAIALLKANGDL